MKQQGTEGSMENERSAVQLTREFDFPRESLFEMITDPKKAAKWFGSPEGAVKVRFEWDARPGGSIVIHDRYEGKINKTSGKIVELVVPERFVFRSVTYLPGATAPFEALQTMILEALGPKRTRVTVQVKVLTLGSFPAPVEALEEGFQAGWGETLNMLQRELSSGGARA